MSHHLVLRVVANLLLPFILVFALYVQWHGDYGPGGGFQAGVVFASGLILYALVYGVDAMKKVVSTRTAVTLMSLGVLIFAGTGLVSLFLGQNFLDYSGLAVDPVHGQERGILIVELGVGIAVAGAMVAIFSAFAGRTPDIEDKDW